MSNSTDSRKLVKDLYRILYELGLAPPNGIHLAQHAVTDQWLIYLKDSYNGVLAVRWLSPWDDIDDIYQAIIEGDDCGIADHMLDEPIAIESLGPLYVSL